MFVCLSRVCLFVPFSGLDLVRPSMATLSARKAGWGRGTPQQQPQQHLQKENSNGQETTPVEKKRKVTAKELGSSTGVKLRTQQRRAFASMLNVRLVESSSSSPAGKALLQGDALAAGGGDAASTLASDVEALLGMKMVGKTKFDFKVRFFFFLSSRDLYFRPESSTSLYVLVDAGISMDALP